MLSPFVMSTFTALLLVLSFIDGAAAADGTSPQQAHKTTSGSRTRRLETTWPALLLVSKFLSTSPSRQSSPVPDRPRFSSVLPAARPSSPRLFTTGYPDLKSPPPRPVGPTTLPPRSSPTNFFWQLTSAPVLLAGGDVVHCQVQLANKFHETLNASGSTRFVYGRELGPGVAQLCRVDEARVSDVGVFENQHTGLMVLRFNINPPLMSCRHSCFLSTSQVAETARSVVNSLSFNLTDPNWRTLYVDRLPAFYSWTDDGPCPNATCSSESDACRVSLSGEFYCECVKDCRTTRTAVDNDDHNSLFALFVIPCVFLIILIIMLVLLYRRRYRMANKVLRKTVRDYKPVYDVETLKQQPMLATLDPANELYRQMECQLGHVYNHRSFDNASFSAETLSSRLSTIRASTVGTSSVITLSSDGDDSKI